ncbi:unknown protein [Microcystis aeruginosa NIES-843]|uniref:Uncharacterized protein n=1 Tax=Microcystis aeruginosa (strain NIES-843 / IAM M-2473) TaxID=449447 RepID=B0JRR9_MICAN|nr:unknown protein [Microcystis aeruginosa NIES-843]
MHHKHSQFTDQSDSLPAFFLWVWIRTADSERIGKNILSGFKAQAVIALVCPIFVVVPCPLQFYSPNVAILWLLH